MEKDFVNVAALENEIEARLVDTMLKEKEIPHLLRSFYDSALNGIYQLQKGWGYIEAPEKYSKEINNILLELRKNET